VIHPLFVESKTVCLHFLHFGLAPLDLDHDNQRVLKLADCVLKVHLKPV
jgi:hypothetical protein